MAGPPLNIRLWAQDEDPEWGFVVYRTIYTEESDKVWDTTMDRLLKWLRFSERSFCQYQEDETSAPLGVILRQDQALFENASIDFLRRHFNQYELDYPADPERDNSDRHQPIEWREVLLVIDNDVLQGLLNSLEPEEQSEQDLRFPWILAIDPAYIPGENWRHNKNPQPGELKIATMGLYEWFEVLEARTFEV
jgi:hypothetical protein